MCERACVCASSGLCLFLAPPERFCIYSALLLGYKSIHEHPWSVLTPIWFTVVVEKWYPFCLNVFFFSSSNNNQQFWPQQQNLELKIKQRKHLKHVKFSLYVGIREHQCLLFHLSTVQSLTQREGEEMFLSDLTTNKKKNRSYNLWWAVSRRQVDREKNSP